MSYLKRTRGVSGRGSPGLTANRGMEKRHKENKDVMKNMSRKSQAARLVRAMQEQSTLVYFLS